ncbi:MAG TPA: IS200/IS605 family transposase [Candidatus Anaerotignum merdipullorum]|nr:IS200/IS605 family transposase [Candidatus Anaerotignum merdipullorum]
MNDIRSLSPSKWRCKYHIVFAPKYRRQVIYKTLKADIRRILKELCERKGVNIVEAECCSNHIHMLVEIPPHLNVSGFMGYLKSKSSLMIFDRHVNLKYKYGNRHFWCRGYFADTVGRYETEIKEYIKNQLEDDIMNDQISLKEFTDPFTGESVK